MTDIAVVVKMVPDLVEELEIDASGTRLDTTWLRQIINEYDDHAIEQAILLKEKAGGRVTLLAPEADGIDDVLFTANAKGADRLMKLAGDFSDAGSHALAKALAGQVRDLNPDLVLTGVQANNELDGSLGPLLAEELGMPYIGYVSGIQVEGGEAVVQKEYPGGLRGKFSIRLPAVIGVQAAEQPPRYVAVSKVRQAMKETAIREAPCAAPEPGLGPAVRKMFKPVPAARAVMLDGNENAVAARLIEILRELEVI